MNYKFIGFIAAAAAMSLVSCQKQEFKPSTDGTVITVNANVEDPANISKTYVEEADGVYNINWSDSESMAAVGITGTKQADIYKSSSFTLNEDGSGIFELGSNILNPENETVAGVYPFTAAIGDNYDDVTKFKVVLPNTQSPVEGSYDPNAYVMIARPESIANIEAAGNVWNAYYYRAAALNRFSITGLEHGGEITSARIIFAEKTNAAGRRYFDLTGTKPGEFYRNDNAIYENIITLKYATPLTAVENEYDLWFTTWNVEVPTTSSFTVEITTDSYKYTKVFAPKKDGFVLAENCLNLVALDMTDATVDELDPALNGKYLILGKQNADFWYYMAGLTGTYFSQIASNVNYSKDFNELKPTDFVGADEFAWTIELNEDGRNYIIYREALDGTKSYLSYSGSGNSATTSTEPVNFYVTKTEDNEWDINPVNYSDKYLCFNPGADRFAFYSNRQEPIYLLPWVESTEPMLIVSQPEQTVAAEAESVSFTYVAKNITGAVTAVEGTDDSNIISAVSVDQASSTVNVTLNPNTEEVEKTATITLSTEETDPITLTITQRAYMPSGGVNTVTFVVSDAFSSTPEGGEISPATIDDITISGGRGQNTNMGPKRYNEEIRMYYYNTLTVSGTEGTTITSIEFTASSEGYQFSSDTGVYSDKIWTGSSNSVTFTNGKGDSNKQFKTTQITVTYTK